MAKTLGTINRHLKMRDRNVKQVLFWGGVPVGRGKVNGVGELKGNSRCTLY
jgi:hypothetical protein